MQKRDGTYMPSLAVGDMVERVRGIRPWTTGDGTRRYVVAEVARNSSGLYVADTAEWTSDYIENVEIVL